MLKARYDFFSRIPGKYDFMILLKAMSPQIQEGCKKTWI